MTTIQGTGTVGEGARGPEIRLKREFAHPIADVWASVTESSRLERWIGRWEGDPATGKLMFFMTAEGDDVEGEEYEITECDPPKRFAANTRIGTEQWHLHVELTETDGATTLLFSQVIGGEDISNVGPGWEYYLDRLGAVLDGADAGDIAWDAYYPALRGYYEALEP